MAVKALEIETKDYGDLSAESLICAFADISFVLEPYEKVKGIPWFILDKTHLSPTINYSETLSELNADLVMNFWGPKASDSKNNRTIYRSRKKTAIRRMRAFVKGSIKGYKNDIKQGVISGVTIFYPSVRTYQNTQNIELRYFTLIQYFTGEQIFRVSKIINDGNQISDAADVKEHVVNLFENVAPGAMANSKIYDYDIYACQSETDGNVITVNQIFSFFIKRNFGITCDPKKAMCAIAAIGEVIPSANRKSQRVTKAFFKDMLWIAIKPKRPFNYIRHCRLVHCLLPQLQTFQKMLYMYIAQTKKKDKHRLNKAKENVLQDYIDRASRKLNVDLNVEIKRLLKKEINKLDIIGLLVEKICKGLFSAVLEQNP